MIRKFRQGQTGEYPASVMGDLVVANWIAPGLSALWLFAVGIFFLVAPSPAEPAGFDPARFMMGAVATLMPVALIWVGAMAARNGRQLRAENARLRAAIEEMRQVPLHPAPHGDSEARLSLEEKLDEIARAQKKTEAALAHLTSIQSRAAAQASQSAQKPGRAALSAPKSRETMEDRAQPTLALGIPSGAPAEPISAEDFIRALDFPADEHDKEGFRALRLALRDRSSSGLIRSAQDILTLLAENGIYMDDLTPDLVHPEVWRRFAKGQRGQAIAALGGIRDRECLALTAGRMRQDPVFRDCAHHFLRKFDTALTAFEKAAVDAEIEAFADTRSARAFMLIGRVSGTFD
ncbi:MAG: hypothetical protein ACK5JR_07550 [Tropicimonas sp.]|uniref:hypothetical protein n=1 Tax=Tropicimonas sp. TaxID=2067044 RepID=UPI003A862C76